MDTLEQGRCLLASFGPFSTCQWSFNTETYQFLMHFSLENRYQNSVGSARKVMSLITEII